MQKSGLADNSSISSFLSYTFLSNAVDKRISDANCLTVILYAVLILIFDSPYLNLIYSY